MLFQPTKLFGFLDAATKSLTTDPAFGLGTMKDLAESIRGIGLSNIQFVTVPNETYAPDPNRVQWKDSADVIWTALREDRRIGEEADPSATPSPTQSPLTVSPDGISVQVLNGAGAFRPREPGRRDAHRPGVHGDRHRKRDERRRRCAR